MLKKEELESWNGIFPDCKINEKDLANPTEKFLTPVLCAYLREFGYKVDLIENGADFVHEKRLFLIKLVWHIDRILKISHESYAFTYYDLKSPTHKRTSKMLSILLNYLHYYNMYKMETVTKAKELVNTYKELQEKVKKAQEEKEKNEKEAMEIGAQIEQLTKSISTETEEFEKLKTLCVERTAEVKALEEELKQLDEQLNTMDAQKRLLNAQVVSDAEAHELEAQLKQQTQRLENTKEAISSIEKQLQEREELLCTLEDMKKQLIFTKETMTEFKEQCEQLLVTHKSLQEVENKKCELLAQIEQKKQAIKDLQAAADLQSEKDEASIKTETELIEKDEKTLQTIIELVIEAEKECKLLAAQMQEQAELMTFLDKNIAIIENEA